MTADTAAEAAQRPVAPEHSATALLEVQNLVVTYRSGGLFRRSGSNTAVRGVSLNVPHGATVGVVGQSGSGKSSLARALVGLETPTSGVIRLDGQTLDGSREAVRRRRAVQMVFQDSLNSLNPRRTIGFTLAEPLAVHGIVPVARRRDRVAELLENVGLPADYMRRRPSQLSGGQRQRVNIARALACEPQLIVADEPTSALDVSIRAQILDLLLRLQRERSLSYIFISHDLHVVKHMSEQIIVMRAGEIVETADRATLAAGPSHPYTRELLAATPSLDDALYQNAQKYREAGPTP